MRVLLSTPSQAGHLNPILDIARQVQQAGHDVLVTTSADQQARLDGLGLPLHPAGAGMDDPDFQALIKSDRINAPGAINLVFGLAAQKAFDGIADALETFQPDLVVSDPFDLASHALAERAGVPLAVFGLGGTVSTEHVTRNIAPAREQLRQRAGLPGDGLEPLWSADWIFGGLPSFAPEGARLPERTHFARPAGESRNTADEAPEWVTQLAGKRSVYFTFGTAMASIRPGYMETVLAGLAAADLDAAVVTVGPNRDPAALPPLPSSFRVERYIPQSFVLPHVAACVSHAGYSVMSAVQQGLPLLLVPFGADQPDNAAAMVRLGLALQLDKEQMTPETVRDAITQVLGEPTFRERARAVGKELEALPTAGAVVEGILRGT